MAAARKTPRRTAPAKTGAKHKGAKRQPVKASLPPATPAPSTGLPSAPPGFLIVGIGASAGGLEAMEEFFRHMPPSSGMAFVVVSHQHAGHVSLLPSLLSKCTAMPVVEATDGMEVEANRVYMAPGGTNLAILHGTLHLMEPASQERVPLPIDYFFRSLAEDQKQRAVGIILSGTGSDGTVGLRAIKAESGMTIAQEPQSAKYQGMPRSAIAAGVVDVVKPASQMSEPLLAYARSLTRPTLPLPESDASQTLRKIFILLRDRTGNDFSLYKENTIHRRIERRMNVHQIENMRQYLRFVLANPHELDALFQELLIGVTSFFRDPQAFEVLAQKALPALVEGKPEGATLRLWVAGCSTGEEAYSLAILIREYLTQQKLRLTVQIFASDLDSRAIETARIGLYPIGIAGDIAPERLQRFFTKEDGSYRVKKEIRDLVVFATHNVLTDAPFTKLDLLSCRNLLIYLEAKAQQTLLPLFHYALKPHGILFLGSVRNDRRVRKSLHRHRPEMEALQTDGRARHVSSPGTVSWRIDDKDHRGPRGFRGALPRCARPLDSRSDSAAVGVALRAGGGRRQWSGRGRLHSRAHRHLSRTGSRPAHTPSDRDGAGRTAARSGHWRSIRRPAGKKKSCATA